MSMLNETLMIAVGGVETSLTFLQAETNVITTASTYTFTSVNIGAANVNRVIACAVYLRGNATAITSATIGGVSATVLTSSGGSTVRMQIIYASVPTGTTASVVINTGGTFTQINIATYRIITVNPTHADTQAVSGAPAGTPLTALTGCNVGFWVVAHTGDNNGVTLSSATNGTIDASTTQFPSNRLSACGRPTLPTSAVTFVPSSGTATIAARNVGWA